jgi:hypothetical protein
MERSHDIHIVWELIRRKGRVIEESTSKSHWWAWKTPWHPADQGSCPYLLPTFWIGIYELSSPLSDWKIIKDSIEIQPRGHPDLDFLTNENILYSMSDQRTVGGYFFFGLIPTSFLDHSFKPPCWEQKYVPCDHYSTMCQLLI